MPIFDFDKSTQEIINRYYSIQPDIDWKTWLELSSSEEFIERCIKNSGLSKTSELFEKVKTQTTSSRELSVELDKYLIQNDFSIPPIMCHTSGTTNSSPSALKWFHMDTSLIKSLWAPGMKAIFESSGLKSDSSAIIFVPSRMHFDGINNQDGTEYISLYSSEFSQRLVLSMFRPKSYVFYPYRKAFDLEVISSILNVKDISVVSAPAATILKWADLSRLKAGIQKYLHNSKNKNYSQEGELRELIQKEGIDKGVKKIQKSLSEKISSATLIFSISSLSESNWKKIRAFMKWEKGAERFTNLYVGSEIGPLASSIPFNGFEVSRANKMYVFPLTIPVVQYKGNKKLITEIDEKKGNLFISRLHHSKPYINIDIGDVISVKSGNNIPMIGGDISRGEFTLKYNIKLNQKIDSPSNSVISAGDFFSFEEFDINNSRSILHYLKRKCSLPYDSLVLVEKVDGKWQLLVPANGEQCDSADKIESLILNWDNEPSFKAGISKNLIDLKILDEELVNFLEPRKKIVKKVREGQYPKGILKKWPLYVVKSG